MSQLICSNCGTIGPPKTVTKGMVYGKPITVEWTKRDRYKRIVGKVMFTPSLCASPAYLEKTDANYQQIAAAMAWHYKRYAREQSTADRQRYAPAENQARAAKRGYMGGSGGGGAVGVEAQVAPR